MNFAEALSVICGRCNRDKGTCKTCPVMAVEHREEDEEYVERQLELIRSIKYTRDGNWYIGIIGGFSFQVKLSTSDSLFGIDGGRIIKLFITAKPSNESPGVTVVAAYERGWILHPKDDQILLDVLDALFEYFQNHIDEEV